MQKRPIRPWQQSNQLTLLHMFFIQLKRTAPQTAYLLLPDARQQETAPQGPYMLCLTCKNLYMRRPPFLTCE